MESRQAELSNKSSETQAPKTNGIDIDKILLEKIQVSDELRVARENLRTLRATYDGQVTDLTADIAKARQDTGRAESDLEYVRSELDRVLLECERWKSLATHNPIPEPGPDANKETTIANLRTELEIVNRAKTALACQLERKISVEKKCEELTKEMEEQKLVIDNLSLELDIVNKTKTVLEFHKSLDDTIESGYKQMKSEVDSLRSELALVNEAKTTLETQLETLRQEHHALNEALETQEIQFTRSLRLVTDECSSKSAEISVLGEKLESLSAERDDLNAQIVSLQQDLLLEQQTRDQLKNEFRNEATSISTSVAARDASIRQLENKLSEASQEKESVIQDLSKAQSTISQLRDECEKLSTELSALKRSQEASSSVSHTDDGVSVESQLETARADLKSAVERCKALQLESDTHKASMEAKDIAVAAMKDQLNALPLTKALEATNDELLSALRREMDRKNAYIDEMSAKIVTMERCNSELKAGKPQSLLKDFPAAKAHAENVSSAAVAREENILVEEIKQRYEKEIKALKEELRQKPATVSSTIGSDAEELLRRQLAECQTTCDARLESMAEEYERKLQHVLQQLDDNLSTQERQLRERYETDYSSKLRHECIDLETEYQRKLDRVNAQWEKRVAVSDTEFDPRIRCSRTPEASQVRILQTRIQDLQQALNASQISAMEGDEKDEIYQSRIRELVSRLAEMENEKLKLRGRLEAENKKHSEEIQSYIQTVQACFEQDPDLQKQVENVRKIHKRELLNMQAKLRSEYESKFLELKNKFEDKLHQVKESMQMNGSSTGTVVTPTRALSPISEMDDINQFSSIFSEFMQEARSINPENSNANNLPADGGYPDGLCDKVSILKSRAEQLYLMMRRDAVTAFEHEQKRNKELEEEWEDKLNAMEERHHHEIERLGEDYNAHKREMEYASQAAMAAVHSGTTSLDVLKQQLIEKTKEIHHLKKKHKSEMRHLKRSMDKGQKQRGSSGSDADEEDDTVKLEYLRDVLFQYMTGKNSKTLSRVIAAVVNFTPEQTDQVVDHEARRREGSIEIAECDKEPKSTQTLTKYERMRGEKGEAIHVPHQHQATAFLYSAEIEQKFRCIESIIEVVCNRIQANNVQQPEEA
ncbi:unnamed protein product [Notodromas monacha]|uniref:GRIP domain-containing protein n=1 Tax=Notodromas monacha TaxID=399045 RepID=A0A7R9BV22_9CRUS|nr:unnamed protein product [Notodromas monacha]CAG0921912.1 unnamed protein product [Notodromas monacha]